MPHETGTWSATQGRWLPMDQRDQEPPDFAIGRFEETGEIRAIGSGQGRVVDVPWSERALPGRPGGQGPWAEPDARPTNGNGGGWSGPPPNRPPGQDLVLRGPDPAGPYTRGTQTGAYPDGGYPNPAYQAGPPPAGAYQARAYQYGGYPPRPGYYESARRDLAVHERGYADAAAEDDDEDIGEEAPRIGVVIALVATLTWYALAVTLYLLGLTVTNSGAKPNDCAPGASCVSARAEALIQSLDLLPWAGIATVQAVVFALILRWLGPGWRAGGLGFSAATVAAATTTAMYTLLGSGF
jgi:hypothetical protein